MQFNIFQQRLAEMKPGATAYLDADRRVCVAFKPGGKVYVYRDSIYRVAERLGLIPDIDVPTEASRIVAALESGRDAVPGYLVASDSVRWLWGTRDTIVTTDGRTGSDGFDHPLTIYRLLRRSDDPWLA